MPGILQLCVCTYNIERVSELKQEPIAACTIISYDKTFFDNSCAVWDRLFVDCECAPCRTSKHGQKAFCSKEMNKEKYII